MEAKTDDKALIEKYLGLDGVIADPEYRASCLLKETEAARRKELVTDVEYVFSLALMEGDHYLGQGVVEFYLEDLPKSNLPPSPQTMMNCSSISRRLRFEIFT